MLGFSWNQLPICSREQFVRDPDACGWGTWLPRSEADSSEDMYMAFGLWQVSLIFPRKLVEPPVYKGFQSVILSPLLFLVTRMFAFHRSS